MDERLKKVQMVELEILLEVDRICKENGISYFLDFGTLLGAVRHQGFIPWDDDIDIGMPRDDYEKFIKIASSKLKKEYFLQNIESEKECPYLFSKIRKNNTVFLQSSMINLNINQGIFIDIFPYDYFPNVSKKKIICIKILKRIHGLIAFKKRDKISDNSLKWKIGSVLKNVIHKFLNLILSKKIVENAIIKIIKKYEKSTSEFLMCCLINKPIPILINKMFPLEKIIFEGKEFPVIKNRDEYLTKLYGDYMKLPPESERIGHPIVEVKL